MDLKQARAWLEAAALDAEQVQELSTGAGPYLYLALPAGEDRVVLSVEIRKGDLVADVSWEESGRVIETQRTVSDPEDLEQLLAATRREATHA